MPKKVKERGPSPMADQAEIKEKERRVREFLDSKGLKGLLF